MVFEVWGGNERGLLSLSFFYMTALEMMVELKSCADAILLGSGV